MRKQITAIIAIITAALILANFTACNNVSDPNSSAISANGNTSSENTEITNSDLISDSEPEEQNNENVPIYDAVFKGIAPNYSTGPAMTYDEVADILRSDPGHPEWDADSFFLVETIKILTPDECRELAGWENIYSDRAMYKVKVIKDLITDEPDGREENIFISMGNAEWQNEGDPIYAPGEKFTVVLTKKYEGCDFLRTPGAFALRYDAVENDSGFTLYSRRSSLDQLNLPLSENIDETVITSATNNPVIHSQKLELKSLADFLRTDWQNKGISSHFEKQIS